jgi:CDP-diglyceride synthetase
MLIAAGAVLFLLGALHSGLGERLIFRVLPGAQHFRPLGFPPVVGLPQSPLTSLRTTWHHLTIVGWTLAVILVRFGMRSELAESERFVVRAIAVCLAVSGVLWFVGTRGRHVAWAWFLLAAALAWLGARGA